MEYDSKTKFEKCKCGSTDYVNFDFFEEEDVYEIDGELVIFPDSCDQCNKDLKIPSVH